MEEDPIQGVFDFESGNPDGLANWRNQREAILRAVREEWSLPVGRRVRVRLRNIDGEFVGTLDLVRDPPAIDRRPPSIAACRWRCASGTWTSALPKLGSAPSSDADKRLPWDSTPPKS